VLTVGAAADAAVNRVTVLVQETFDVREVGRLGVLVHVGTAPAITVQNLVGHGIVLHGVPLVGIADLLGEPAARRAELLVRAEQAANQLGRVRGKCLVLRAVRQRLAEALAGAVGTAQQLGSGEITTSRAGRGAALSSLADEREASLEVLAARA